MDETKVQIGEEVLLDIGIHSEWYISSTGYDGESVDIKLRKKADRIQKWWFSEEYSPDGKPCGLTLQSSDGNAVDLVPAQKWIPCSERLPKPYTAVLVCDECGWISLGVYRPCDVTEKDSGWSTLGWSTLTRIKLPTDEVLAWMPLPKPWEGADNEKST